MGGNVSVEKTGDVLDVGQSGMKGAAVAVKVTVVVMGTVEDVGTKFRSTAGVTEVGTVTTELGMEVEVTGVGAAAAEVVGGTVR